MYLKNKRVPSDSKIEYLQKRNKAAALAKSEANRHFKSAQKEFKNGTRIQTPTLMRYPHFNKKALNKVNVTNIFNTVSPTLARRYQSYPTIMRILQQPQRNAVRNAYGRMLHHNVPMNVLRTIQGLVGNNTKETAMLRANERIRIQSMVNRMRRQKNNEYWEKLLGRTHASPKRILK
jgi:uncharacterized protein YigA (DUF484 family)